MDAAIISGLSAIGGALVGSVAGGVVGWRLERRRAGRQAKAGARLLRADLSINQTRLSDAISELRWWPFYHMRIEPWSRYRDAMAEELNAEIWGEVSQSAIELQELVVLWYVALFGPSLPATTSATKLLHWLC